jgi:hypothetical protein
VAPNVGFANVRSVLFILQCLFTFFLAQSLKSLSYHLHLSSVQSNPISSFLIEPHNTIHFLKFQLFSLLHWIWLCCDWSGRWLLGEKDLRILFLLYPCSCFPVFESVYECMCVCLFLWICMISCKRAWVYVFKVCVRMLNKVAFCEVQCSLGWGSLSRMDESEYAVGWKWSDLSDRAMHN